MYVFRHRNRGSPCARMRYSSNLAIYRICVLIFRVERHVVPFEDERDKVFAVRQDVYQAKGLGLPLEARVRSETQDS